MLATDTASEEEGHSVDIHMDYDCNSLMAKLVAMVAEIPSDINFPTLNQRRSGSSIMIT